MWVGVSRGVIGIVGGGLVGGVLGIFHISTSSPARDAMIKEKSPIIIDNTNSRAWEMKPYVLLVR